MIQMHIKQFKYKYVLLRLDDYVYFHYNYELGSIHVLHIRKEFLKLPLIEIISIS